MVMDPRVVLLDPMSTYSLAFTTPLPIPSTIDATGKKTIVLRAEETTQWLGLYGDAGQPLSTTVWGIGAAGQPVTYPGPTIIAKSGTPTTIQWQNKLPYGDYPLPYDPTIHNPGADLIAAGLKPIVMHLHGGHSSAAFDGLPEQWYTQALEAVGPAFVSTKFTYDNDQPGAFLWYHDHTVGLTRTNVYMGLAGGYELRDATWDALQTARKGAEPVLPGGRYELPLVIQDRAFTADGQLYLPAYGNDPLPGQVDEFGNPLLVADAFPGITPDAPSIVPEFLGDHILVNGAAWPTLSVERGDYMFSLLNGSDSRFYVLQLDDAGIALHLVGSDGGLLPEAITVMDGDGIQEAGEQIVLAPGDRIQVVAEFGGAAADVGAVRLMNVGPAFDPFKGFDGTELAEVTAAGPGDPVGTIMQFTLDAVPPGKNGPSQASVTGGTPLNTAYAPIDTSGVAAPRKLGLFEGMDELGRVMPQLGTAADHAMQAYGFMDPATEIIRLGDTEIWQIHNFTEDAHPIHLHLVQFQVLGRTPFAFEMGEDGLPVDADGDGVYYGEDIHYGPDRPLYAEDHGWQDTVWVEPGQMISIAATFDRAGEYVWHCHILSHEDHDMMRPFMVMPDIMAA